MSDIALLLLAAGGSRRMKEPKQLLPWGTTTLIEHQIQNLLDTGKSVSVVIGAYAEMIVPHIDKLPIRIFQNEYWQEGMGTSIAHGTSEILKRQPNLDGILISLLDQPLLTSVHFKKMLQVFQAGKDQIIVSKAGSNWSGAPVLFDKVYTKELMQLKGDEGAKIITHSHTEVVEYVEGGAILADIDTPQAYQEMLQKYK